MTRITCLLGAILALGIMVGTGGFAASASAAARPEAVYGTPRADQLIGGAGDDAIYARDGADTIEAGSGNDVVYSGRGADTVFCGSGFDTVYVGSLDTTYDCEVVL